MSYILKPTKTKINLPKRGYFKRGDSGESISIIASFLAFNFLGYESKLKVKVDDMLGEVFGKNLESWIKLFQKNNGLKDDGCIGSITLNKLREYGLDS